MECKNKQRQDVGWASVCFPTHRKKRDGWGTRAVVLGWRRGNNNRDGNSNSNRRSSACGKGRLEQVAAEEFERLLAGPEADSVAIAREAELFDLRLLAVADANVDKADGLISVRAR